jgi:hypothetical protein
VADKKPQKNRYVDNGWPASDEDDHALPAEDLPYTHPVTVINR